MRRPTLTYAIAHAASWDAGNRHMRAAGRTKWNQDDADAAWAEFDRLIPWPEGTPEAEAAKRNARVVG